MMIGRCPLYPVLRPRMQVQPGEDQTQTGPDADDEDGAARVLQRLGSQTARTPGRPQTRVPPSAFH